MRKEFGRFICDMAEKDKEVILISGDIGYGIFDEFKQKYLDRFFNLGICEQSTISFASGIALEGLKPYVYAITPFLIERPFEQIKLDIDNQKANVKLIGYADYPQHGPTHSETDGKTLMSLFKNITSYFPNNANEVREYLTKSYHNKTPTFISLKRNK